MDSPRSAGRRTPGTDREPSDALLIGRRPVLELLKNQSPAEKILLGHGLPMTGAVGEIRKRAEDAGIPVRVVPRKELDKRSAGGNHQGVIALTPAYRYRQLEQILSRDAKVVLFLDGVEDPHNLGSLIRSAEVAGLSGVVIPARRAAGVTPAVRRVSAGAAERVPVARVTNLGRALEQARREGFWVVGLDQSAGGDIWTSDLMEPPVALVMGNEEKGMSRMVREGCDELLSIPQRGEVESLNVAVAGAVAMFELVRRSSSSATL